MSVSNRNRSITAGDMEVVLSLGKEKDDVSMQGLQRSGKGGGGGGGGE